MAADQYAIDIAGIAAAAALDRKAENVNVRDVTDQMAITEAFVIASASNERQVNAIIDNVEAELIKRMDLRPRRREGKGSSEQWVLLDYGDIVVHVFDHEAREFYGLDSLWKDCPEIEIPTDSKPTE
ncbi:ribosome silencing factor [Haloglycomyces albus]|uniref:ribosome silencing factor n=1 Tax=Haloglycomyces albus TaxID=526067 RepID=UPI00046D763E|nr:ribosome silencing factor [Haloglycomyces albus]